jgi:hypothetical protein
VKTIDRLSLIDRIGRELQARMRYADIGIFLRDFGVDITKETSQINSKWVYTKELLADEKPETILRVADELGIAHGYTVTPAKKVTESTFWEANHFRLFLSHLSTFKKQIGKLQSALRRYGISAFVAHVDIEPTREWQDEIEAGLYSMDALAAVLMPGFKESSWTDQEVGIAIGRGVLIIPVIRGLNPYGFIGKFQGLQANGKTVAQVAHELFGILIAASATRNRMYTCLINTTLQTAKEDELLAKLEVISSIHPTSGPHLEQLREGAARSSQFLSSPKAVAKLNDILSSNKLGTLSVAAPTSHDWDDDVPF